MAMVFLCGNEWFQLQGGGQILPLRDSGVDEEVQKLVRLLPERDEGQEMTDRFKVWVNGEEQINGKHFFTGASTVHFFCQPKQGSSVVVHDAMNSTSMQYYADGTNRSFGEQ